MKQLAILVVALTLVIVPFRVLHAQDTIMDSAYYTSMDRKIDRCQKQAATLLNSSSENLQRYSESAQKEADFYREHRTELVKKLSEKGIGTKQYQVDSFLEKAFKAGIVNPEKAHIASQ
jgi:hypothetical protein